MVVTHRHSGSVPREGHNVTSRVLLRPGTWPTVGRESDRRDRRTQTESKGSFCLLPKRREDFGEDEEEDEGAEDHDGGDENSFLAEELGREGD